MGNSSGGNGEVSEYQFMTTNRFNTNDNFTGSMGNTSGGIGEVSKYQSTPTNRIISNNLIGTGGDQIGGGGYFSTVTNPVSTMRVVSNNLSGSMASAGGAGMGGYIAETIQNVPTYRQTQNFDYSGPIQTANSTEMTATGEAERNMYFRDDKEALLQRLPPTTVNAFQGPTPESMYSMHLKTIPSTMMTQMGALPSTGYLPFISQQKNIQIPQTYTGYNPVEILHNNPYVNNILYQSNTNIPNQTVGYGSQQPGQQYGNGMFYQSSHY
jgi:hypothetical protein